MKLAQFIATTLKNFGADDDIRGHTNFSSQPQRDASFYAGDLPPRLRFFALDAKSMAYKVSSHRAMRNQRDDCANAAITKIEPMTSDPPQPKAR